MSDDNEEEYGTVAKKKVIDLNINVAQNEKKVTSSDAEQVSKELSAITGEDVPVATTVAQYDEQRNKLRLEVAGEIGRNRETRSRKKAHERTSFPIKAIGQSRLTGEQATGEDFSGVTGDLKSMEFDSFEDMITTLRELEKQGDVEATKYLGQLYKRAIKEGGRKHMKAEFVGKISKIGIRPNENPRFDEEYSEEVKEKIKKEMSKWKEEED